MDFKFILETEAKEKQCPMTGEYCAGVGCMWWVQPPSSGYFDPPISVDLLKDYGMCAKVIDAIKGAR